MKIVMKLSTVAIFLTVLITGTLSKPANIVLGYQDSLGQYSFGYSAPHQARSEVRSIDGITRGSYSYIDGAGLIQSTDYTADGEHGFRVAATNLPQAPVSVQETAEVAAARAAHLSAVEKATVRDIVKEENKESDTVVIQSKSNAEEEEKEVEKDKEIQPVVLKEEISPEAKLEESVIEEEEETKEEESIGEIQTPEALAEAAAEADAEEKKKAEEPKEKKEKKEKEEEEKARSIVDEPASVAPVIASPAASLPVPLIPVNFDLPIISAYSSSRPGGAKAEQTLPQATPAAQGIITPAGTTLKTLPSPQLQLTLASRIGSAEELVQSSPAAPAAAVTPADNSAIASGGPSRDLIMQYERARAVFAPISPFNVIPIGYEPTISSFLRYAPFPYITYNIL